ncbi:MmgE/PrpD family protein [Mesorhizobium sp. M0119]|uniref:MmgE/PrpD family protein n=1 Tax=Mesorhizobium sp. M0119 TaxID=2956885 RepID=UPI003338658C
MAENIQQAMQVASFIHDLDFVDVPADVRHQARRCLIDTLGVAIAGARLPIAKIVNRFAARHLGTSDARGARLLLDGREVSVPGAAMAGAAIIDGYDAHDGHVLCKGHVGVTALPAALAFSDSLKLDDFDEFLTLLLIGYEVSTRAGIALHATSLVFHSSGAWNSFGPAAIGARMLRLSALETCHALGIAEYYGPRSPLMRVVTYPTMLKDGSTMGAFAGTSAAYLAAEGFTGAPVETVDLELEAKDLWSDLGQRWRIVEQYVKPLPVCRWTQPAVQAVLSLRIRHPGLTHEHVQSVAIETFHEAVSLSCREPSETDAAQYSLPFTVAAALVHGRLTPSEIAGVGLFDPDVLSVSRNAQLIEMDTYNALFPAERWANVRLTLKDGTVLDSGAHTTIGDAAEPLSDDALMSKFRENCSGTFGCERANRIAEIVLGGSPNRSLRELCDLVTAPNETNR